MDIHIVLIFAPVINETINTSIIGKKLILNKNNFFLSLVLILIFVFSLKLKIDKNIIQNNVSNPICFNKKNIGLYM